MRINRILIVPAILLLAGACSTPELTSYVDPFLGSATLWKADDLGFEPVFGKGNPFGEGKRIWGAETFPGSSLPNAMVQATPVTMFGSGSGYQREDAFIQGFAHTNKGHWNLCNVPMLPVTGDIDMKEGYASPFSHEQEAASPGYYRVFLDRYGVNVELTSTLRCALHRYDYTRGGERKVLFDLSKACERVLGWGYRQTGPRSFSGRQVSGGGTIYFWAEANADIAALDSLALPRPEWAGRRSSDGRRRFDWDNFHPNRSTRIPVLTFADGNGPLELRVGFSYVSEDGAKANLDAEIGHRSFEGVHRAAVKTWEKALSRIQVKGGAPDQLRMFYSCLYRTYMWPVLRSDVNGDFISPVDGSVVNTRHRFYTTPSYWDDYRNKLILLGMLSPDVVSDVIASDMLRGERTGFMPIFFHGDHASVFVTGSYLRGIRGFDVQKAYELMKHNATEENPRARPHLAAYDSLGYVPELNLHGVEVATPANTGVTRTLGYSYDDYAVARLASELGHADDAARFMARSGNFRNVFDTSTGFMRGRTAEGPFVEEFDPYVPYFYYQYREANCWQSSFFAPHDPAGLIGLYPSPEAFEAKLDQLFTDPWRGYMHHNMTGFLGNYCHGNQPDHGFPYMYYFVNAQPKAQEILNVLMSKYYGMGDDGLALAGMDDAGEMSAWYVFNAIGLYTFSPADPEYIVTVPLFDEVKFRLGDGKSFRIVNNVPREDFVRTLPASNEVHRPGITMNPHGVRISRILVDGKPLDGWFVSHSDLAAGKTLEIR